MTKLETTIRQVSDLRDFYMKIRKEKSKNQKAGTAKRSSRRAKAPGISGASLSYVSRRGG